MLSWETYQKNIDYIDNTNIKEDHLGNIDYIDNTNIKEDHLGNIDYIDNTNIKEDHLGIKKLHLNKRGNSVFIQNLLRYLRSKYWENANFHGKLW